jgi:hypothetical protein
MLNERDSLCGEVYTLCYGKNSPYDENGDSEWDTVDDNTKNGCGVNRVVGEEES